MATEPVDLPIARDRYGQYLAARYRNACLATIPLFGIGLLGLLAYKWYRTQYVPRLLDSLSYALTDELLILRSGVYWQSEWSVPLWKTTRVIISQGPLQRQYGISVVHVHGAQSAVAAGYGLADVCSAVGLADPETARTLILERMSRLKDARPQQSE